MLLLENWKSMMKQTIRKWAIRLSATGVLSVGLLVGIVMNPAILYANKTVAGHHTVYHNAPLDESFLSSFRNALSSIKKSSLYNEEIKLDICLDDGSFYPVLMEKLRGRAFGWGFYNKVVLRGEASYHTNTAEINGYKWNLTQLIAHEAAHCLQFMNFGLWRSNPIAGYPNWKWEGYAEYVARRTTDQRGLVKNITRKIEQEQTNPDGWAIAFDDGTIAPRGYYQSWLLMIYCLDVKGMNYQTLLNDESVNQASIEVAMMKWYDDQMESTTHCSSITSYSAANI